MAIIPPELLQAQPQNQPAKPKNGEPEKAARRTPEFKRNLFISEGAQGIPIVREGARRGRLAEGQDTSEYVGFSDNLREVYRRFLDNHLTQLTQLMKVPDPLNPNQTVYDAIMRNPNHVIDRELMKLFGSEMLDMKGRVVDVSVSEDRINRFLDRPEGWIITTQLMEYQTAMKLFALGFHAANIPEGRRQRMADPMVIRLGINQGVLNRFRHEVYGPNARDIFLGLFSADATLASSVVGLLQHGPLGAIAYAAIPPALYGMYRAMQSWRRNGLMVDLRQSKAAFEVINSDPVEQAYVKQAMGIDTRDFTVSGNRIVASPRIAETTRSADELQFDILKGLYARQQFYEELGIPREKLDALPEQFLYRMMGGEQEKTGAKWEEEVQRYFNPNLAILDTAGRDKLNPDFLGPDPITGNPTDYDYRGNISRNMEARRKALHRHLSDFTRKQLAQSGGERELTPDEQRYLNRSITVLEDRRNQLIDSNSELRKGREKQFTELKTRYDTDRTQLQQEKGKLTPYLDTLKALREARDTARREFGVSDMASIDAAIKSSRDSLVDPTIAGSYAIRRDALETQRNTDIATVKIGYPWGLAGKLLTDQVIRLTKPIDDRIDERQRQLKADVYDKVQEEITRLNALRTQIQENQRKLENTEAGVIQAREKLESIARNHDMIGPALAGMPASGIDAELVAAGLPPVGIDDNILRTEPINVIMDRINAAHTAGAARPAALGGPIAIGWPSTQNERPELRMRVMYTIVEARARGLEAADPARAARVPDYDALVGWNITENQLRTLSVNEVHRFMNDQFTSSGGAHGWEPANNAANESRVRNAIEEAQSRLRVRMNAFDHQEKNFESLIQDQDEQLKAIKYDTEVQQIDATVNTLKRFGSIQELSWDVIAHRDDYASVAPIVADRNYTQAEKDTGAPRGYYEMVDLLTGYKEKANRSEYFQHLQSIMPPDRLATLLNTHLNLGVGVVNMTNVLNQMRARMNPNDGRVSTHELRRAFRNILETIREEGMTIAA